MMQNTGYYTPLAGGLKLFARLVVPNHWDGVFLFLFPNSMVTATLISLLSGNEIWYGKRYTSRCI
jgi:hypothetical protein